MNDSTPPKDGEPTSFVETAKNWYGKHRPKILAVGAVGLAVVGVVASLAEGQNAKDPEDAESFEPVPDPEAADRPARSSPSAPYDVAASLVKLNGRRASEMAKANYKRDTGEDLPDDRTYRRKHRKNVPSEEDTPAEASA
ncbi:hypothetical protein ACWD6I_10540 [Streptomyces sp. NPDC002454]